MFVVVDCFDRLVDPCTKMIHSNIQYHTVILYNCRRHPINNDKRHFEKWSHRDAAVTGMELVILIAAVIFATALSGYFLLAGPGVFTAGSQGFIPGSVNMNADHLRTVGSVWGFSAVDAVQDGVAIRFRQPDRARLGAAQITIVLFIGNPGGVDMDRAQVVWMMNGTVEPLSRSADTTLICPNWTITRKTNMLPGQSADADTILEPNEQFELLICPSGGALPYQPFIIAVSPPGTRFPFR
jgi:hypothetical protein